MALKSKYITGDDFKEYFGIDLNARLKDDDNPSNKVNAFLKQIEDRLATFIDSNFYKNVDRLYPQFSDYQKEHYKLALLEQAYYVIRNSDISSDSGYDVEKGVIITPAQLKDLAIAPNCKQNLILCGLWNRKLKRGGIENVWWY